MQHQDLGLRAWSTASHRASLASHVIIHLLSRSQDPDTHPPSSPTQFPKTTSRGDSKSLRHTPVIPLPNLYVNPRTPSPHPPTTIMFHLRPRLPIRTLPIRSRPLHSAASFRHTVNKKHELDVQSLASKQGMRERSAAGASEEGEKVDPKKDHPKAPTPVIGMQDERGHSGSSEPGVKERVGERKGAK